MTTMRTMKDNDKSEDEVLGDQQRRRERKRNQKMGGIGGEGELEEKESEEETGIMRWTTWLGDYYCLDLT